ncbi:MAG TPA: SDR family NAD(P)-dependent oxidoreductase, partial [Vicinamibacteria bacterium]|nr:SDR family NAD(P)-dependent oxidoreductase [Vicinamibacteria bacterium]
MKPLEGRVALVTGGGAGIGRACAVLLAQRGADVAIHFRNSRAGAEETAAAVRAARRRVHVVQGDLTSAGVARATVAACRDALGAVDILVNNAGDLIARKPLADLDEALFRQVMDVNVTSAFLCAQAAAPGMVERRSGAIVNVSSLAAHNGGGPGALAYSAAKGAVISLTKAIAKELAPHGVRVNCVSPGLIGGTDFHGRFTARDAFDATARTVPLGRAGTAEEV